VIRSCSGEGRVSLTGESKGITTAESRKVEGVAEIVCCWLRSCRVETACVVRGEGEAREVSENVFS